MKTISVIITCVLLLGAAPTASAQQLARDFKAESHGPDWSVKATQPYLIGGYGDNFDYDGSNVKRLEGVAYAQLNTEANEGWLMARFTGTIHPSKDKTYSGDITIFYPMFMSQGPEYWEGGVADYVVLHGNTGREAPVMPAIPTYVATWGPAMVMVNGERVMRGPGHTMLTERSRNPDTGAIYANDSHAAYYSPMRPSEGVMVAPGEQELHFVFHTEGQDPDNFPKFASFIHLNYATVELDADIPPEVEQQAKRMQQSARQMMQHR